jgi:CO dehydrogenase maturation factor
MKIAVSGKGGVGKSTLAAALALMLAESGRRVIALDADPDANLASALGIPAAEQKKIIPIARHKALVEERTGAKVKQYGQMFKLNPEVSDIADAYSYPHRGINLLVLGAVESGGSGCACPENVLVRALVMDLVLHKNEALIMDMEAGIEHLGRATAQGVDAMIIVVEPGSRSLDTARRIRTMAGEIKIRRLYGVGNKVMDPGEETYIRDELSPLPFLGFIPYSEEIRSRDRDGRSVLDGLGGELRETFRGILRKLEEA